jgi:hypothetical protein
MESAVATPAPAQPAAPEPTISATRDAANRGDFGAFEKAEGATRDGKPLPDVHAAPAAPVQPAAVVEPPAPAAPAQPDASKGVSKRQAEINEHARRAAAAEVENAQLRARLAALEGGAPKPHAPAAPAPAAPEEFPDIEDWAAKPENAAKKFGAYLNERDKFYREQAQTRAADSQAQATTQERVGSFDTRVNELAQTDPAIVEKIAPIAQQLGAAAKRGGPAALLSDLVLDSDVGPRILAHFHDHPETLSDLLHGSEAIQRLPLDGRRVRAHTKFLSAEFTKLETTLTPAAAAQPAVPAAAPATPAAAVPSPVSSAPPPAPILTRPGSVADTQAAAIARGDFVTFDRLEVEKEHAKRARA